MRTFFLPLALLIFINQIGKAQDTIFQHKLTWPVIDKNHPDRVYDSSGKLELVIALDVENQTALEELQNLGFHFKSKLSGFILGVADTSDVLDIASHPKIKWIDAVNPEPELLNDGVRSTQRISYVQSGINYPGLFGNGVTVGIGDGGDLGEHIDFGDRVTNLGNGAYSSFGQHQDHVSGIVAGAGNIKPEYRGIAPEAELITQKTSNINYYIGDYYNDYGMVLTNNSYGSSHNCTSNGSYNYSSSLYDQYMIDYPEVQIVVAAGNSGGNTCGDYPLGYHTVLKYYQSAKNVLTVGNVGKNRIASSSSSRGPVKDGRIKPEIMGVGTSVLSTGNHNNYYSSTGTSMASPAVTGTLALMVERYRQLNSGQNPGSGLLKAIACNTADDLGNAHPDYIYGFGLINARRAIEAINNQNFETEEISEGQYKTFTVSTNSVDEQLKILLYWNDPAADPYPETALINNLDLFVISPSGDTINPWVLNPDAAFVDEVATRGIDDLNNIEQATIDNPEPGNYTVKVFGKGIPLGNQEFFIAYDIIKPELVITHPAGNEVFEKGKTISIEWEASPLNEETFTIEYTLNDSLWIPLGSVNADQRQFTFELPDNLSTAAQIRVKTGSQSATSPAFSILGSTTIISLDDQCDGEVELFWEPVNEAEEYVVYQFDGNEMSPVAMTTTNSTQVLTEMNQVHWFSVAPVYAGSQEGVRSYADSLTVQCLVSLLPVELIEFSGTLDGPKNLLQWITGSETQSKEFVLERSSDTRQWEAVEVVEAAGEASTPRIYFAEDYLWFRNTYYRLKMIDFDGTFEYSETIILKRENELAEDGGIHIFPVPANEGVMVRWNEKDRYTKGAIRVFDNLKRKLLEQQVSLEQRAQQLDVSSLLPGMYTIQKGSYIQKLVITRDY